MKHFIQFRSVVAFVLMIFAAKLMAQDPPDISLVFYLDERSENGTLVGTIVATDPDMDNPTFSIVSGNDAGAFSLNTTSGDLTVADEDQLDFDVNPSFTLVVEADDGNGGITTVSVAINLNDIPLGLEDTSNEVTLYPNPVIDVLHIDLKGAISQTTLFSLYTIEGRPVAINFQFATTSKIEIDCRELNAGLYILRISNSEVITSKRVVVVQ